MRSLTPTHVFVVALIALQGRAFAQDLQVAPVPAEQSVSQTECSKGECQQFGDNGFDQYRQQPDAGAPGSPGSGFKHFPFRLHMFTTWHRPRAGTLTQSVRCAPDHFRPRGFGHLFAEPCDSFRMDYSPHVLTDDCSQYGPAYLLRAPDDRCAHCDHPKR
ncbi:MAG: hypothetical protein R3C49_09745 [Planctomycetaceae bacterium]